MSKFKKLTFLKVLTTVAWADGEVTQSELNILKSFYRKFNLDKNELDELKPFLNAPISNGPSCTKAFLIIIGELPQINANNNNKNHARTFLFFIK